MPYEIEGGSSLSDSHVDTPKVVDWNLHPAEVITRIRRLIYEFFSSEYYSLIFDRVISEGLNGWILFYVAASLNFDTIHILSEAWVKELLKN